MEAGRRRLKLTAQDACRFGATSRNAYPLCITHEFGQRPVLQCIHETPSTMAYDATAQLSNAKLAHGKVTIPTFWVKRIRSFASSKLSAAAVPSAATRALSQSWRDSRRTGSCVIDRDFLSCGHLTGLGFTWTTVKARV